MARDIVVGSVSVEVVPSARNFARDLRAQILPNASRMGEEWGKAAGDRIEAKMRASMERAYASSDAKRRGARAGEEYGGEFGRIVRTRVTSALRALPDAKIGADTTEVDLRLAGVRSQMDALSNLRVGVDVSDEEALAAITDLRAQLDELRTVDASPSVRANVGTALAELAAVQAELDKIDGRTVDVNTGPAVRSVGSLRGALVALSPVLVPIAATATGVFGGITAGASVAAIGVTAFTAITAARYKELKEDVKSLEKAQKAYNAASDPAKRKQAAAQLAQIYAQMGPAEVAAAREVDRFRHRWELFTASFDPTLFRTMTGGMKLAEAAFPRLRGLVTGTGDALTVLEGDAERALGAPFWVRFFNLIGREGPPLIVTGVRALGHLGHGLASLVAAFLPEAERLDGAFLRGSEHFAHWADGFAQSEGFRDFTDYLHREGPVVLHTLGDLGSLFLTVARDAAPFGGILLRLIDHLAQLLNTLLGAHPTLSAFVIGTAAVGFTVVSLATKLGRLVTILQGTRAALFGVAEAEAAAGAAAGAGGLGGLFGRAGALGALRGAAGRLSLGAKIGGGAALGLAAGGLASDRLAQEHQSEMSRVVADILDRNHAARRAVASGANVGVREELTRDGLFSSSKMTWKVTDQKAALAFVQQYGDAQQKAAFQTAAAAQQNRAAGDSARSYAASLRQAQADITALGQREADTTQLTLSYKSTLAAATATAKAGAHTLNLNTEAGRQNMSALLALRDSAKQVDQAMAGQGKSIQSLHPTLVQQFHDFVRTAEQMGATKQQAADLARKYGLIPHQVETRLRALGFDDAIEKANGVWESIRRIHGKRVTIDLHFQRFGQSSYVVRDAQGHTERVGVMALGGPITGGIPGKDSVPLLGMPGEFVVRADGSNLGEAIAYYARKVKAEPGGYAAAAQVAPRAMGDIHLPTTVIGDPTHLQLAQTRQHQTHTARNLMGVA